MFVNTMLPKEITCPLNQDCEIILPVNGKPVNEYVINCFEQNVCTISGIIGISRPLLLPNKVNEVSPTVGFR